MNIKKFIKRELKDRTSQQGLGKSIWNFFMFPFTVLINFIIYRKWMKLMSKLGINENELGELISISIKAEQVSYKSSLKKYGEYQPSLKMNECYIVERKEIFIFPCHTPKTIHHYYTELKEPIIIGMSNSKHPYETLWGISTFTKITNIVVKENMTKIDLKGELFDNKIQFKINKKLDLLTGV